MPTTRRTSPMKAFALGVVVVLLTSLATAHAVWPPTPDELKLYASSCTKTDVPMKLTHWSSITQGMRWANAGKVDQGEIDFMASNDQGQYMGGGLYLAEDTTSSKQFGSFPTFFDIPAGVCLYSESEARYAFGVKLDIQQRKDLGRWVPQGVMWVHSNTRAPRRWFATTSGILATKVTGGDLNGVEITWPSMPRETAVENFLRELDEPNRPYSGAVQYLRSLFNLWTYFDGIAFLRAIRTTSNPFNEFEPQNFPAYDNARSQLHACMWTGENKPAEFAQWKLGDPTTGLAALKYLYNQIAGSQPGTALPFRTNVVRAGGSTMINGQGYFQVTPKQKQALIDSPYLTVEEAPGQPLMVAYYYPDATHYAGIEKKGKILDAQLLADLKAGGSDPSKQPALTARIIEACINYVIKDNGDRRLTSVGTWLALDLVSIHPWGDMNGRTTRLYGEFVELALRGNKGLLDTSNPFIGDFDLVTPQGTWVSITDQFGADVGLAKNAMVKELVRAIAGRRMPDYFPLPEIEAWAANSFATYGVATVDTNKFTTAQWDMVRQRQFVKLMEQLNPSFENSWISKAGVDTTGPKGKDGVNDSHSHSSRWSMSTSLLAGTVAVAALAAVLAAVMTVRHRRQAAQGPGHEILLSQGEMAPAVL